MANSGELYTGMSFSIAARPFTVVGKCGMIPVLKSQKPSESLGFVHTDRFPNGSGPDRSSVHTEPAIRRYHLSGPVKVRLLDLQRCRSNFGTVPVPYWTGTV